MNLYRHSAITRMSTAAEPTPTLHRDPKPSDFVGKTIAGMDTDACNVWTFRFADGSALAIEVEAVAPGIYGMVVCEECAKKRHVARTIKLPDASHP